MLFPHPAVPVTIHMCRYCGWAQRGAVAGAGAAGLMVPVMVLEMELCLVPRARSERPSMVSMMGEVGMCV